jgi:nitrogen fixation NifU-like protein
MTLNHDHDVQDEDLYRELILDHNRNPRNVGRLEDATIRRRDMNTSCGDDVEMSVLADADGKIVKALFAGDGCAISKAVASMLTESIIGKTLKDVETMGAEAVFALVGTPLTGSRLTCALLPLKTLQKGIVEGRN